MRSDCFGSVSEARGVRSCPTARPHTTPVTLSCPQGCDAAVPNLRAAQSTQRASGARSADATPALEKASRFVHSLQAAKEKMLS